MDISKADIAFNLLEEFNKLKEIERSIKSEHKINIGILSDESGLIYNSSDRELVNEVKPMLLQLINTRLDAIAKDLESV